LNISLRIKNLINKHQTRNPFLIARYENIAIHYASLGSIKGLFQNTLDNKMIAINSDLDEFSQLVICSHELGHALLHSTKGLKFMRENTLLYNSNQVETEANTFAAELLIDEDIEYNYYDINSTDIDPIILKKLCNLKNMIIK